MKKGTYRFRVGAFECMVVEDGTHTYAPPMFPPPQTFLFANAPKQPLAESLGEHGLESKQWNQWESPYHCLLINTGDHLVFVDAGAGTLDPQTGKILEHLQREGISPGDIDTAIITHGHPDHIGGLTLDNGSLIFPNARYVMLKKEWEFWTSGQAAETYEGETRDILVGIANRNLPAIEDRVDLLEGESEIVPGVHAVPAPGHTPGHMVVSIAQGSQQLLYLADTVLHPIHMEHPDWIAVVDLDPRQVIETRHLIFNRAAADDVLLMAFHFPFPGLGRIRKKGKTWRWQPTKTSS